MKHVVAEAPDANPNTASTVRTEPHSVVPEPIPDVQSIDLVPLMRAVCGAQFRGRKSDAILSWTCAMLDSRPNCRVDAELLGVSPSLVLLLGRVLGWSTEDVTSIFLTTPKQIKLNQKKGWNMMDGTALTAINVMRLIHRTNTLDIFRQRLQPEELTPLIWLGKWIKASKEGTGSAPAAYLQLPTGFFIAARRFERDAAAYPALSNGTPDSFV